MKIGIDISQIAYGTGVGNYLKNLVENLIEIDKKNEYVLFGSSFRQSLKYKEVNIKYKNKQNVSIRIFNLPPTFLDFLWNRLHIVPIEWFIGDVDIFISSDWTQPPTKQAKKLTILYDLIVYKYPRETAKKIVKVHTRKLAWVKREIDLAICISEATKKDAMEILNLPESKLKVIYPGI